MTTPLDPTVVSDVGGGTAQADGDESYCAACGQSYALELDVCPKDGARLTKLKARPDALLGRVFDGRFEVRSALGQGGMGTVYRGWQLSVDREVAIKVIHAKLASDRTAVKRFLREARLSSRLNQPNIINVYDFGQTEDGILFIAMELLRGHTLASELEAQRGLSLKRVATMALQLCDALDSAHAQGIVHRDLKPGNIIILDDPPGRDLLKVLDFGLAKSLVTDASSIVTHTNAILGTPLYMPPEQIEGRPTDQRADLYSLGCMLYQMVSGRPPFVSDSVNLVLAAHVTETPPPLPAGVPPLLAQTIAQLLEKDPARRIASARAVREAIEAVVDGGFATGERGDPSAERTRGTLVTPPPAFAVTAPLEPRPGTTGAPVGASPAITVAPSIDRPIGQPIGQPGRRRARRWLAPLLLAGIAGGVTAVLVIERDRDQAPPAAVVSPPDAAQAAPPDAAVTGALLDAAAAGEPLDAALAVPPPVPADASVAATVLDAGRRRPPKPPRPPRTPPDAGVDLQFLPTNR